MTSLSVYTQTIYVPLSTTVCGSDLIHQVTGAGRALTDEWFSADVQHQPNTVSPGLSQLVSRNWTDKKVWSMQPWELRLFSVGRCKDLLFIVPLLLIHCTHCSTCKNHNFFDQSGVLKTKPTGFVLIKSPNWVWYQCSCASVVQYAELRILNNFHQMNVPF